MTEHIQGGAFAVARKIFYSGIWLKPPLFLKIFIWCLGRASYEDHEKNGFFYKRGEFVTTYYEIIKAAAYHHNRKHIFPTLKQIRIIINWLVDEGMITVEPIREIDANPLKPEHERTGADTRERTRAYVGIKIIVVNYDAYQDSENYKGRHKGRPTSQQGHNNNKGTIKVKKPEAISDEISPLKNKYKQDLIERVFQAIASTRKTGKVADNIFLTQLKAWERYPVDQVEAAMRTYLDKGYSDQGKGEKYLLGIIRNQKQVKDQEYDRPKIREITSDNIEALYEN